MNRNDLAIQITNFECIQNASTENILIEFILILF